MTRLLHFGDAQLGAGKKLGVLPSDRLRDQEEVLDQIVDLAIRNRVDAVVNGGDTWEGPEVTSEQYAAFQRPMRRLYETGIPLLMSQGNGRHDLARRDVSAPTVVSDICEVFTQPGIRKVGDTYVAMLPWCPIDRLVAEADGGDRGMIMVAAAERLIQIAQGLYASIPAGSPSVLVPHFAIEGASLPSGLGVDRMTEVILPLEDLRAIGFDAIAASHVHLVQYVIDENGWMEPDPGPDGRWTVHRTATDAGICFYTGSPLPIDFGEASDPHGVWLIETSPGENVRADFIPIPSRSLVQLDVDLTDPGNEAVLDEIIHGDYFNLGPSIEDAIVKVTYKATREQDARFDQAAFERAVLAAGASKLMPPVATIVRATRARIEEATESLTELAALDLWITANGIDEDMGEKLRDLTTTLLEQAA